MLENSDKKPLIIVDGYGFIFRAYHVQPPLTSPSGEPVGAIYGFTSMLIKLIAEFKPEKAVIVLDHSGKNFRHNIYEAYKANRPPAPDDLVVQLKIVEKAARALNFECISKQGYEADDIIATLATKANKEKHDAIIISSDKDLMQLLDEHIKMYDPMKSKFITKEDVLVKFGVGPDKVREVQALMGDSSDNIPGVSGVGPKTASGLINQFGDLESVLSSLDQIKSKRQQELLRLNSENARISWQLVGLDKEVELPHNIDDFAWIGPESEKISDFLNEYGFKSLVKRVENLFNVKIREMLSDQQIEKKVQKTAKKVVNITSQAQFDEFLQKIEIDGVLSVSYQKQVESDYFIFVVRDEIYRIISFNRSQISSDLFLFDQNKEQMQDFTGQIKKLFSDGSIKKIVYDLKEFFKLVPAIECKSFEDLQLMNYILTAGQKQKKISDIIAFLYEVEISEDNLDEQILYFADIYNSLESKLFKEKLLHIYRDIDLPLCYILDSMEQEGVKIDASYLGILSDNFAKKIKLLESKIYELTGEEFNIASPKQLGEILFNKMKLPFAKVTGKTKSFSTNSDILEKLAVDGYEIAELLLKWRHFTKLKNTYTDSLPKQINPRTGRIHTTFLQTITSTGRLSSVNPNVQNIPTRTEEGGSIRAAFIVDKGKKLISADYSQIELRILSHVADIKSLKKAMSDNRDIHSQTASQIFQVKLSDITQELRRSAKAINFGIIYGISAFGLAKQLNISRKKASDYIEKYFQEYPGIQKYMSGTIEFAKENGYVQNLLGRKCFIPTINDKNYALRSFGERAAINAPMQGLASDIVKVAMLNLSEAFKREKLSTKMIMQIHDELIFEAPEDEVAMAVQLIKSVMESAINLDVRTDVEVNFGDNWQEIH